MFKVKIQIVLSSRLLPALASKMAQHPGALCVLFTLGKCKHLDDVHVYLLVENKAPEALVGVENPKQPL